MTTDSPITDAAIEAKKEEFKNKANEGKKDNEQNQSGLFSTKENKDSNFNEELFNLDAKELQKQDKNFRENGESSISLDSLFVGKYIKSDKDDDKNNNHNNSKNPLSFNCFFENGFYTGMGSDGTMFKTKDFYEMNLKIASQFKMEFDKKGKIGTVRYTAENKDPQKMQDFARAFINSGVRVAGDIPQDPQFWQSLKNEYLSNPDHSPEQWDNLTSNLSDELVGRSPQKEQSQENANSQIQHNEQNDTTPTPQTQTNGKNPVTKNQIKAMSRNGYNPRDPEQVSRHDQKQKTSSPSRTQINLNEIYNQNNFSR